MRYHPGNAGSKLESVLERLALYPEPGAQSTVAVEGSIAEDRSKVFVVHGREEGPREAVARFLERLGFRPIILHEQANQGMTVIEKVEANSDVGFAVIILTPDDVGALKGEELQPRARQNELLELGYFIGKLTRRRVCTLKVGELEIPSDWRGVVDEPYDAGRGWRQTLARELKAAEYEIDWNKVMSP
jgi:predicted nucleotide-binding protein